MAATASQSPASATTTATAAPQQEEAEEEVFEIREWLDEDGNEVRSEVMSVTEAVEEVAKLDLLGALERATAAKQQKGGEGERQQGKREAADALDGDKSPAQRLLDVHDWAGIKARAQELERLQEKKQGGGLDAEADTRWGRDKLEGLGWAKGFLNSGGSGGGGGKERGNEAVAKAKAVQTQQHAAVAAAAAAAPSSDSLSSSPPLTVDANANAPTMSVRTATATGMATKKSALSSPEKKRGDRPRKQVSFQLVPEQEADQGARALGPLADYHRLVQQGKQLRLGSGPWGEGEEETKEEGKRRQQPWGPVPFSGRVAEASAAVAAAPASAPTAVAALPTAAAVAAGIPPGMSRFKAQALGLLPPESN